MSLVNAGRRIVAGSLVVGGADGKDARHKGVLGWVSAMLWVGARSP